MMSIFEAEQLARNAHGYTKRRNGKLYITHPFSVAELLQSKDEIIIALLHDVVEDTDAYLLMHNGKPCLCNDDTIYSLTDNQFDALAYITKTPQQIYKDYIGNICTNHLATKVKIADITHNLLDAPSTKQLKKYQWALKKLVKAHKKFMTNDL